MADLTRRVLPPEEWPEKLRGTALEHRDLNPACTRVVVVERDGQVIASCAALTLVHAEGLSIVEVERGNPGVARALLQTLLEVLVSEGVPEVLSQSESPEMDGIFARVGGSAIPGTCWVIPIATLEEV